MLAGHETRVAKETREEINLDHQNILVPKVSIWLLKAGNKTRNKPKKANHT